MRDTNMTNTYAQQIALAFDARKSYEVSKNSECDSMLATLKTLRETATNDVIANILAASNVDANFINKSERSNARFNVYAAEKVLNVALNVAQVKALNHYTRAILHAAIALEANETLLTYADAQSACSLKVKVKDAKREKIISKAKYQKNVELNTVTTQSSSSIAALKMFNVLIESRDAANVTCYKINRECDTFKALTA
jgi:hypothetical protein